MYDKNLGFYDIRREAGERLVPIGIGGAVAGGLYWLISNGLKEGYGVNLSEMNASVHGDNNPWMYYYEGMRRDAVVMNEREFRKKYGVSTDFAKRRIFSDEEEMREWQKQQKPLHGIRFQNAGQIIHDNMGQWAHPGKNTMITGNASGTDIVNYNDPYSLLAVSNLGEFQYIPANDPGPFHFQGSSVVEYPIKHQYGGLLGKSRFTDVVSPILIQSARAGLPVVENVLPKSVMNTEPNSSYWFYAQNYGTDGNNTYQYVNRPYGDTIDEKKSFVLKSFDDWYHTFQKNGHSHDDSVRMAKFFALQDSLESQYGSGKAFDTHNYGGMNDVAEARRQGKHFVHKRYNTAMDYYNAKYKDIASKWPGVFDGSIVTNDQFMSVLNGTPGKQYAPPDHNEDYAGKLNKMTSAKKWIDEYSNGYSAKPNIL